MNLNKICPECDAEYLPHIERCADCGATLLLHEEYVKAQEKKKQLAEDAIKSAVKVREGDLKWLSELREALIDAGIPSAVTTDDGCGKGCCSDQWRLMVAKEDVERAQERIEEYFAETHPEIQASAELIDQGKCPACGSPVRPSDKVCPDCGLTLVIVEEDSRE